MSLSTPDEHTSREIANEVIKATNLISLVEDKVYLIRQLGAISDVDTLDCIEALTKVSRLLNE